MILSDFQSATVAEFSTRQEVSYFLVFLFFSLNIVLKSKPYWRPTD